MKAIVLLSGGLDSATCLYWAKSKGYRPHCILFDYNQRHKKELKCAVKIAKKAHVPYEKVTFSLPWMGSSLLDKSVQLPSNRSPDRMSKVKIPNTYVPARNTIFLSLALSYADAIGAESIIFGANALDYSGYPDCRPKYVQSFQEVAIQGTKRGSEGKKIRILAPLIHMSKREIIQFGQKLRVPYQYTWSCYSGGRKPCGLCDSCVLRKKGFDEAGIKDTLN